MQKVQDNESSRNRDNIKQGTENTFSSEKGKEMVAQPVNPAFLAHYTIEIYNFMIKQETYYQYEWQALDIIRVKRVRESFTEWTDHIPLHLIELASLIISFYWIQKSKVQAKKLK